MWVRLCVCVHARACACVSMCEHVCACACVRKEEEQGGRHMLLRSPCLLAVASCEHSADNHNVCDVTARVLATARARPAPHARYAFGEDLDLKRHMDQSEVTLNVCIGGTFEGADVFFQGQRDHPMQHTEQARFQHRRGFGLLHAGQHWHGSNTLLQGDRQNLIMWGRSSNVHASAAESFSTACGEAPADLYAGRGSRAEL